MFLVYIVLYESWNNRKWWREHAICQILNNSNKIDKIFCFPGNAGTSRIAQNINIDLENFNNLKKYIIDNKIDLVIVGPEKPLVDGLVDYLEKFNIKTFGPNKIASQLEGSKIFTKNLCKNLIFQLLILEFLIIERMQKNFLSI